MHPTVSAAIAARIAKGQTEEQARAGVTNALISAAILARVEMGQGIAEAYDAVLGAGSYQKLASDTYDALRTAGK